jgi:hypothetical protein
MKAALTVQQTLAVLRKRLGILYGEDIPMDKPALVDWGTARVELWGKSAGMEVFKEERDGRITITLGGKVTVIDIELAVDRKDIQNPVLNVTSVKTSFAVPNGTSTANTSGSTSLDGFLADNLSAFLAEVQKKPQEQDPENTARIGMRMTEHFKYLMRMDQHALKEGETGLKWFNGCDMISIETERYAAAEGSVVAK